MRVSHIRPTTVEGYRYRLGLLLHSHLELDREHKDVNLRGLSQSSARELLKALETRTGLVSGVIPFDSMPEDSD